MAINLANAPLEYVRCAVEASRRRIKMEISVRNFSSASCCVGRWKDKQILGKTLTREQSRNDKSQKSRTKICELCTTESVLIFQND